MYVCIHNVTRLYMYIDGNSIQVPESVHSENIRHAHARKRLSSKYFEILISEVEKVNSPHSSFRSLVNKLTWYVFQLQTLIHTKLTNLLNYGMMTVAIVS